MPTSISARDQQLANTDTTLSRVSGIAREQVVSVTDLISEGPIEGLVSNEASIYLNEDRIVPVKAASIPAATTNNTISISLNASTATTSTALEMPNGSIRTIVVKDVKNSNVTASVVAGNGNIPNLTLSASSSIFTGMGQQQCRLEIVGTDTAIKGTIASVSSGTSAIFRLTTGNANTVTSFLSSASGKTIKAYLSVTLVANASSGTTVTLAAANTLIPTGTYSADVSSIIRINFGNFGGYQPTKFDGITAQFRTGTAFQTPMTTYGATAGASFPAGPGFSAKALEKVDYKSEDPAATAAAPPEFRGTSSAGFGLTAAQAQEIDEVRLTFQYNALYSIKPSSGAEGEGRAFYKIELTIYRGLESSTVVLVPKRYHSAKNKGPFIIEEVINLEPFKPFTDFSVKVTRLSRHNGTLMDSLNVDGGGKWDVIAPSAISTISSVIKEPLTYPYTAYANITFSSKEFSSMPTRTYHARGMKVLVPSNYTTREENNSNTATYSGLWNGTFRSKKVYTNNPAWVFYDILTNDRYGLGAWISEQDIDKYSLYRIGRYCDELVPDGKGGLEPRFTANLYLTKATDAYKVLKDMATIFRGILYWLDGAVTAVIDQDKDPVYTFSKANVIDGAFAYQSTGSKTRSNQLIISWNNPESGYALEPLIVEDRQNIIETGRIITEEAVAFGCTSEGQAYRYGRWKLWTAVNQTEVVSFNTSINAAFLAPGDIIVVQDADRYGLKFGGRISNTGSVSTTVIPLDREITLKPGHTYEVSVLIPGNSTETGSTNEPTETTVETKYISTSTYTTQTTTSTITLSSALSQTPTRETIWVVKEINNTTNLTTLGSGRKYRIVGITENSKNEYSITAVEHYSEKFTSIESDFTLALGERFGLSATDDIPPPDNIIVIPTPDYTKGGDEFQITWDAPTVNDSKYRYTAGYELVHNVPGYPDIITLTAKQTSFSFMGVPDDVYNIGIRTVSSIGTRSVYNFVEVKVEDIFGQNIPREAEGLPVGARASTGVLLDSETYELAFEEELVVLTAAGDPTDSFVGTISALNTIPTGVPNGEYFVLFSRSNEELKLIKYRNDSPLSINFWYDVADAGESTPESRFTAQSGVATVIKNSSLVTGSGTSFTSQYRAGDIIRFGTSRAAKVLYVKSNTSLLIDRTFSSNITSSAIYKPTLSIDFLQDTIIGKITITDETSSFISYLNVDRTLRGLDALAVNLIPSAQVIRYDGDTETDTITFTVEYQGTITPPEFIFYVNDVEKQEKSETSTFELADEDEPGFAESVIVKVVMYQGDIEVASDIVTIYGIKNGTDTVTAFLTNESHVEPSDSDGVLTGTLDDAGGQFKVFVGVTDITTGYDVVYSVESSSGLTIEIDESSGAYTVTALSGTKGAATLRATIPASAIPNSDTGVSIDKVYSIAKSIAGVDGTPGIDSRAVILSAGTLAFAYASDGSTPSPENTVISAEALNTVGTVYYDFLVNGTSVQNTTTSTYTYTPQSLFANMPETIEVKIREGANNATVKASDAIAIVGLRDAEDGVDGDPGVDALTIILSNEAHTLPTTNTGTVTYTGSGTTIRVYEGTTELVYDGTGTANSKWKITSSASNITRGALTDEGNYVTVGNHSNMTANSASISYTISGKRANGTTFSVVKTQTFAKSLQGGNGSNGVNARAVTLSAGKLAFAYASDGSTPDPANTTITATTLNTSGEVYYDFLLNGTSVQNGTGNTYTYTPQAAFADMPDSIEVRVREGSNNSTVLATDSLGIVGLRDAEDGEDGVTPVKGVDYDDGLDALTVVVSNEAHTLPTTNTGTVTYTGSGTTIRVYEGTTELLYDGTGTANSRWKVTSTASNITRGSLTDSGAFVTVADHSAMNADAASITYTISGKRAGGGTFSINKTQTFSKSIQGNNGSNGVNARTVTLSAGKLAFAYASDGSTPDPENTEITATALNTIGQVYYDFLLNGTSVQNGTGNTYTYTPQANFSDMPDSIEVRIREGASTGTVKASDSIGLVGLRDAINGINGINGTTPPGVNSSLGLVTTSLLTIDDTYLVISRAGTSNAWDQSVRSTIGYNSGAAATLIPNQTNKNFMFGLNSDPTSNDSYTSLDYSFYIKANGDVGIYESSSSKGTFGTYTAGDVFVIIYDNKTIKYLKNGSVLRTVTVAESLTFYFDSSFNTVGDNLTRSFGFVPIGSSGTDALTLVVSNESHTLPTTNTGVVTYTGSGTTIRLYEGTTELQYDGTGTANGTWKVEASDTNITAGGFTDSGAYVTVGDHSAMDADSASITYTVTGKRLNGAAISLTKTQTFAKSKQGSNGSNGTNARAVNISAGTLGFAYASDGSTPNPESTEINAEALNTVGQVYYDFLVNGTSVQNGTGDSYTYTPPANFTGMPNTIAVSIREGASTGTVLATDTITVVGLRDAIDGEDGVTPVKGVDYDDGDPGVDALTVIVSNEAHTLPTTNTGTVTYTGSGTTIRVYEGTTELLYDGTGTANSRWKVTTSASNITRGTLTDSGNYLTVGNHSAMNANTASITYTISGKRASGDTFSIVKTQTFSKSIQGNNGTNGTTPVKGVDYDDGDDGTGFFYILQNNTSTPVATSIPAGTYYAGQVAIVQNNSGAQAGFRYNGSSWAAQTIVNSDIIFANAIKSEQLAISSTTGGTGANGIYMNSSGTNNQIEIWASGVLRVRLGKL